MPDTGWVFVGAGANYNDGSGGVWTSPGNITADDASNATKFTGAAAALSQLLYGDQLGFTIAADEVIVGIEARIEAGLSTTNVTQDKAARLFGTDGNPKGDDKASAVAWSTTGLVLRTYGGPGDLWGETWTPAEINNAAFGFGIGTSYQSGGNANAQVDYMQLKIHLQEKPLIGVVYSGSPALVR